MKQKTTQTIRKCLSLLFAVAILLTMQGVLVQAETAEQQTREMPQNPVHHCAEQNGGTDITADTTDWSYVYFGSYPQTEITGDALTSAIIGASYDANGDAWIDGTKYRRISKSDTNYDGYFGDSDYRYFKWERIKWRVLQNDGSSLFVVADRGLDCKDYHSSCDSITWENCTLRNWLNTSFYGTAFDSDEQGAIVEWGVINGNNPMYGTEGGNSTRDKIYLLSIGEMKMPAYGFCENSDTSSISRRLKSSDYAHVMGASGGAWLRSPGGWTISAALIMNSGYVDQSGINVDWGRYKPNISYHVGVVPALHINLSSDRWSLAEKIEDKLNPVHHCTKQNDGTDTTDWRYVYFGSYPQTEITGDALTSAITGASYDENGDAWVDGTKYRRISKSDTNYDEYFGDSDYRYFKWERIKWRVLQNDGYTLFVVADRGLDCKDYHSPGGSITWENCTLRNWLNTSFYSTAFDSKEQEAIVEQGVINGNNSKYGTEGGNDT